MKPRGVGFGEASISSSESEVIHCLMLLLERSQDKQTV